MQIKLNAKNLFFTSDTHYGHKNIVRGVSEWSDTKQCRPFDKLEEHNQALIDNINRTVGADSTLIHLGDWSFGGEHNVYHFRKAIKCKSIILVLGNHDHHINKGGLLDSYFDWVTNYLELTVDRQPIVCTHYAHRVWNRSHHGAWHLYGHSHGTINNEYGKSIDVGVDTHPEFRPYSFDEIKKILDRREILNVDHHNPKTNK
jgi:calcineurin-like phosphoesterase family protein